jgi:hypothetical protein
MLKKAFSAVGKVVAHPLTHPVKFVVGAGVVYLLVDHVISDKGRSTVSKLIGGAPHRRVGPPRAPAALPAPPAAAAQAAAAGYYAGAFQPGWGRGYMNTLYGPAGRSQGGGWPETGADISVAHRSWGAASGEHPEFWTQSFYPWA